MPAVTWGRPYGDDPAVNSHGRKIYMFRKGQKVRWYDSYGDQVGPEQANVAPALAWSYSKGYESEFLKGRGIRPVRKNPSKLPTAPKHTATGERIDSRCTST